MRKLAAEALGTFALVFAGTGAIVINDTSGGTARSLAPALVSWRLDSLWVYMTAPVLGACGGVLGCWCVREPGCCQAAAARKEACS